MKKGKVEGPEEIKNLIFLKCRHPRDFEINLNSSQHLILVNILDLLSVKES